MYPNRDTENDGEEYYEMYAQNVFDNKGDNPRWHPKEHPQERDLIRFEDFRDSRPRPSYKIPPMCRFKPSLFIYRRMIRSPTNGKQLNKHRVARWPRLPSLRCVTCWRTKKSQFSSRTFKYSTLKVFFYFIKIQTITEK